VSIVTALAVLADVFVLGHRQPMAIMDARRAFLHLGAGQRDGGGQRISSQGRWHYK
jgi:hypothetical protein